MSARVRAFDWEATALGAIARWPEGLATVVDVVLSSGRPMLLWWGERAIQIYNDAARGLLGDRHPAALGAPVAETWPVAWSSLGAAAHRVLAGRGAQVLEHVVLGTRRQWSLSLDPVLDGRGGVGGVLAIAVAMPASIELERELADTQRECEHLVEAERVARRRAELQSEYLQLVFMQAPAPIAVLRGPHRIIDLVNDAMAEAWGHTVAEALGRPVFDVIPEARTRFEPVFDAVLTSGKPLTGREINYRTERTAEGERVERFANVLFAPCRDLEGRVDGLVVIAVDITDEIRSRNEMQRLRGIAEATNRAKDEFLAMLGHELRNPLAPISTTLRVMRLRGASSHDLDVLERQVGHLTRLVDDLLDVSRATRGKLELHERDVELAELVSEALEISNPLLEQRRHVVEVEVPQRDLGVHVDRERMVQAISNLIANAAKYSDPGSRITLRGTRNDGKVRLSVRDRGVGIPPEMLDRVFELFVQQEQTIGRARGGLGLGLAIVRSLVELHGGKVSATSEGVGHGSEFSIELPALAFVLERVPEPAGRDACALPAVRGARILVVDDNEDAATTLGRALEQLGYQVAVANDGPAALRIAETFDPDLALLDLGLPVMDGYELAERLRATAPRERLHLVAVTGYGQESDRERSARAGFERHLVKPVELGELCEVVAQLVAAPAAIPPPPQ